MGRVYDTDTDTAGGSRVLVDRLWPRGLTKEKAALAEWCREVSPSAELRRWYGHDPEKFAEFRRKYRSELHAGDRAEALAHLRELARGPGLTLLTATKDVTISEAAVLAELIETS